MANIKEMRNGNRIWVIGIVFILGFARISFAGSADDEKLLSQTKQYFGQLPHVIASEKNPATPAKVNLGKILFYESRISVDGTVSCARCHPIGLYAALAIW